MARILSVKHTTGRKGTANGKPLVFVQTAAKDIFVPLGQWLNKGSYNLDAYNSGTIDVVYYAKGEKLLNGAECTADNTLVKDLFLTKNTAVVAGVDALLVQKLGEEQSEKAAFMRRMRNNGVAPKPEVTTTTTTVAEEPQAGAVVEQEVEVEQEG